MSLNNSFFVGKIEKVKAPSRASMGNVVLTIPLSQGHNDDSMTQVDESFEFRCSHKVYGKFKNLLKEGAKVRLSIGVQFGSVRAFNDVQPIA